DLRMGGSQRRRRPHSDRRGDEAHPAARAPGEEAMRRHRDTESQSRSHEANALDAGGLQGRPHIDAHSPCVPVAPWHRLLASSAVARVAGALMMLACAPPVAAQMTAAPASAYKRDAGVPASEV